MRFGPTTKPFPRAYVARGGHDVLHRRRGRGADQAGVHVVPRHRSGERRALQRPSDGASSPWTCVSAAPSSKTRNWSGWWSGWAAPREPTTVTGSSRTSLVSRGAADRRHCWSSGPARHVADGPALKLRATADRTGASAAPLTIELFRWSTDAERAPLLAALSAPPPSPPPPRLRRRARGRSRGSCRSGVAAARAAPPQSPMDRLTTAIKAAPTSASSGATARPATRSSTPGGLRRPTGRNASSS